MVTQTISPQLAAAWMRIKQNWAPPPQSENYRQAKAAAAKLTMAERKELREYLVLLDSWETCQ